MKDMAARNNVVRPIAIIIAIYAVLLAGGVRWHWAAGPPYDEGSVGLLVAFALGAALVGLISIWASFTALHWSMRASGVIAGAALLAGLATLFFEWNDFLIWQLILLVFAEWACTVVILGAIRLCGYTIRREVAESQQTGAVSAYGATDVPVRPSQFRVRDLLLITAACTL